MFAPQTLLLVFLGAGLGGALRHVVNGAVGRALGAEFPWGILSINVAGSLAMGLLAGLLAFFDGEHWSQPARLFMTTGVLGGFTTFSAFSLDAVLLLERGEWGQAVAYVVASVALSIGACLVGLALMRAAS
jgi:CrcB protein